MNYRSIRSIKTKKRLVGFLLPLCVIGAIMFFHRAYPTALRNLAAYAASPFWKGQRFLEDALLRASLFFTSKQALARDRERLSAELERARALLSDRELLINENRFLKEQFGRAAEKEGRLIGVVISTPPRSIYDTVVIDIGTKNGVQTGDKALFGSLVLGVVSRTFPRTSLVEFFSTAGKETPVIILHEGKTIPAEATGRGGGEFRATLPKNISLFAGDTVILPAFGSRVFAFVEAIEESAADSFQTIRFKNPVSLQSLRFLEIQREADSEQF